MVSRTGLDLTLHLLRHRRFRLGCRLGIYITGSSLIGVAIKAPRITSKNLISEQKVSANKLKQQAVKASYEHERQKYAETSQSIPSYSCPNGGKWLRSSHSEKKMEPEASFEILTNPAWVVPVEEKFIKFL